MSALGRKVLDLAELQGLLDGKAIAELRKKVAESKFVVSPEAIAKVLVDHGHLTPFQARKLVSQALGDEPDPLEKKTAPRAKAAAKTRPLEDLTLADDDAASRPKQPSEASEEIIDLELVDQPAQPSTRPAGQPKQPLDIDDDLGATAEDYVDLEPVEPAPRAYGQRWKTDPAPLSETVELSPLDVPGAGAADLAPIDDLFELDPAPARPAAPLSRPAKPKPLAPSGDVLAGSPLTPMPPAAPRAGRRPLKNVWDSPLLLIGGGLLGVILVAFAILFYALTRGTAAELFAKAEEEYRSGSFVSAAAVYEDFLERYPSDANASLARVRRGMAKLRQIADEGNNPRLALETAQQALPQIEKEEKFGEARPELSSILPAIADGLATRAVQATDSARKQEAVKLAGEALSLVNNPSYLPTSLRQDRENQIARIVDKLKAAERGIQQDKDLAQAIERIGQAADKGNAAEGYRLRGELLRTYPGLDSHPELVAAIRKLGEKERDLVKVTPGGPAPLTDDHPPTSEIVILSAREGDVAASATGAAAILLEGSVYGVEVASGRILWRRFVGYELTIQPVDVTTAGQGATVMIDARRQELVAVETSTGKLHWRQPLQEEVVGLGTSGTRLYVTTRSGRVIALDAARGDVIASAQLPQAAAVGPAISQSRVFQPGAHSTLFILDADTLACIDTLYTAHKAGSQLVAPTAALDHVLLIESPADDYSLLQLLALDSNAKKWQIAGQPRRIKGRVVTPPAVSGARLAVTTDLAQVSVFQVDSTAAEPLRPVAGLAATEQEPLVTYAEIDRRGRLWVAGRRRTMYEVQEALQQLSLKWTENQDDRFVAPPRLHGDVLITARRRSGIDAVLLEGCQAATGTSLWTTRVAAPAIALRDDQAAGTVRVLTSCGQLFTLTEKSFEAGRLADPEFSGLIQSSLQTSDASRERILAWCSPKHSKTAYTVEIKAGAKPVQIDFPVPVAAVVVANGSGLISPLTDGRVMLAAAGSPSTTQPFLPPLMPEALPLWTQPVTTMIDTYLISDGRGVVYALKRRDQPQPHLAAIGQSPTNAPVTSLTETTSGVVGILREASSDAVIGFDFQAAVAFEPVPLEGRVEAGPFRVGGLVLLAAEPDGLVCMTNEGQVRWKQPLPRGPLAGPPLSLEGGDLLVAHQSGDVCRLDAATGNELACLEIGQPLSGPICPLGSATLVSGSDGVIHRITVPDRPST